MVKYYIVGPSVGKQPIVITAPFADGLAGTIHYVLQDSTIVVKLYKHDNDLPEYRDKIAAMLAAPPSLPPFSVRGRTYVQISWPIAAVINDHGEFRGYAMPKIDTKEAALLQNILHAKRRRYMHLPEFYGGRVLLAANLAAVMSELHTLGHYMVDMKPLNMMFYPHAWYMAVLDTDGFSIGGPRRFPAHHYTDEYIAPEAKGQSAERLGLEQDLFALAVIIFRLLNNGVHPYLGVDRAQHNLPTTLQDRINTGLYAYGFVAHPQTDPSPASIHAYLEDETRRLFDRAFQSNRNRPTAHEWRDHIAGFFKNKTLVRCATNPTDHAHFSKGCGLCALAQQTALGPLIPGGRIQTRVGPPRPGGRVQTGVGPPKPGRRIQSPGPPQRVAALVLIVLAIMGIVAARINPASEQQWDGVRRVLQRAITVVATVLSSQKAAQTSVRGSSPEAPIIPTSPTPPASAKELEMRSYLAARSDIHKLEAYLRGCQACEFREAAKDEINRLEQAQVAVKEQQTYYAARGNINSLRAYLSSCTICAFRIEALNEIRNLDIPRVTFQVKSNHPNSVELAFYSVPGPGLLRTWPEGGQVFKIDDSETHIYPLSCEKGEVICYGAWVQGGTLTPEWGAGRKNKRSCQNCCLKCPSDETLSIALDPQDAISPTPTLTWLIKSIYPYSVSVAFYSITRPTHAWPGGNQEYVIRDRDVHAYTISCVAYENICYGAWVRGHPNLISWGVGFNRTSGCSNCCYICNGGETNVIVLSQ